MISNFLLSLSPLAQSKSSLSPLCLFITFWWWLVHSSRPPDVFIDPPPLSHKTTPARPPHPANSLHIFSLSQFSLKVESLTRKPIFLRYVSLNLSFFELIPMNVPPLFDPSGGVQGTFKQFKLALEEIKANIGFTQIFILSDTN